MGWREEVGPTGLGRVRPTGSRSRISGFGNLIAEDARDDTKPFPIFFLKSLSLSASEARKSFIIETCYGNRGNAGCQ